MATYEECREIEKKFDKKFNKHHVWFLFFGEIKYLSKDEIETHLKERLKDFKKGVIKNGK